MVVLPLVPVMPTRLNVVKEMNKIYLQYEKDVLTVHNTRKRNILLKALQMLLT